MPNKAFVILFNEMNEDQGYFYFPIKNPGLAFQNMPQFFGGSKNVGESDRDTIAREMQEESNQKLTLSPGGLTRIHNANVGGFTYSFYVAQNYSGQHFLGPLDNNPEMASIEQYLVDFDQGLDIEDLLSALGITASQDFAQSETYTAFTKALEWAQQ